MLFDLSQEGCAPHLLGISKVNRRQNDLLIEAGLGSRMNKHGFSMCLTILLTMATVEASAQERNVSTLYRSSVFDRAERIHVATFDSDNSGSYNSENCQIAAELFQGQRGVSVRYWCERGRYRRDW